MKNHLPSPVPPFSKSSSPLPPTRQDGGGSPRYHVALRTNPNTSSMLSKLSLLSQRADWPHMTVDSGAAWASASHVASAPGSRMYESSSNHQTNSVSTLSNNCRIIGHL